MRLRVRSRSPRFSLAGCSGGDDEAAPAATATRTVTVTEPAAAEPAPDAATAGSLADVGRAGAAVGRQRADEVVRRRRGRGLGRRARPRRDHRHEQPRRRGDDERHGRLQRRAAHDVRSPGTVIGTSPERDLAVIRVAATDLIPLRLARSSSLRLGDAVFAVGFPLGLGGPSVTSGIVSGLDRTIDVANGKLTGLLQTDAAINPGNSGGALVDRLGRLVGINTAGVTARRGRERRLRDRDRRGAAGDRADPQRRRPTTQAWLGIAFGSVDSDSAAVQLGLDASMRGAAVTVVYPGGPGEKADLAVGDVITVADDVPIDSAADLAKLLAGAQARRRARPGADRQPRPAARHGEGDPKSPRNAAAVASGLQAPAQLVRDRHARAGLVVVGDEDALRLGDDAAARRRDHVLEVEALRPDPRAARAPPRPPPPSAARSGSRSRRGRG